MLIERCYALYTIISRLQIYIPNLKGIYIYIYIYTVNSRYLIFSISRKPPDNSDFLQMLVC